MNTLNEQYSVCTIDIGNSRIKILFDLPPDDYNAFIIDYDALSRNELCEKVNEVFDGVGSKALLIGVSSVNSEVGEVIQHILSERKLEFFKGEELLASQRFLCIDYVKGIGQDRAFGMIGGSNYFAPPFVTIDFGTAITINLVVGADRFQEILRGEQLYFQFEGSDAIDFDYVKQFDCICLGGCILPGYRTCVKALKDNTNQLPLVNLVKTGYLTSNFTEGAINSGVVNVLNFGIYEIVNRISSELLLQRGIPLVISGGGKELFDLVPFPHCQVCDYLVNLGLKTVLLSHIL